MFPDRTVGLASDAGVDLYEDRSMFYPMRSLELQVQSETAESLEVEADLLEFDSPSAYVRWLVRRRFTVDDGSERSRALAEYADRVRGLDETGDREMLLEAARRADDTLTVPNREDWTARRVEDGDLADAAAALSSVEHDRVDAFAQRALSRTRERFGDGVGTGIDYSARNRLDDGPPLGAEIADLEAIEVPGWDDDLVDRRREAVGAALAYLKDAESAKRGDFIDELYEEYPAGYESADSWWECIKRGLRQVDRVKPAREDSRVWGFRTTPGRVTRIAYS